jgi:hypothetical protein
MSGDPLQDFVAQIAAQLTAGAATSVWSKVKAWIAQRRPASQSVVAQFEQDPAKHAKALTDVLRLLRFAEDPEGRTILSAVVTSSSISQTASGRFVVQVGGNVGEVHLGAALPDTPHHEIAQPSGLVRHPIGVDVWQRLREQHEADDDECLYIKEQHVMGARVEGWQEVTLPGPGGVPDRLLVVDGGGTLGVPMYRSFPWKGLNRTAQRMLVRAVKAAGVLEHFQSAHLDFVRMPGAGRTFVFRGITASSALGVLARRGFVKSKPRSDALYDVTDDGRRVADALVRARGEAWLDERNPDCEEGWLS